MEGRGLAKGEIGLASMEIHHPELCVSQFSDTGNYTKLRVKLHILNPSEVYFYFFALLTYQSNMPIFLDLGAGFCCGKRRQYVGTVSNAETGFSENESDSCQKEVFQRRSRNRTDQSDQDGRLYNCRERHPGQVSFLVSFVIMRLLTCFIFRYYGLACGAALVRHIEYVQNIVFAKRSVKVVYKGTEKTCMIGKF